MVAKTCTAYIWLGLRSEKYILIGFLANDTCNIFSEDAFPEAYGHRWEPKVNVQCGSKGDFKQKSPALEFLIDMGKSVWHPDLFGEENSTVMDVQPF